LLPYDSYHGRFSHKAVHPELGRVDLSHLSLATVREFFPQEFDKLRNYGSFAIVRNPYTRFLSAVLQHLQEFERVTYDAFHAEWVASRVSRIADRLAAGEGARPEFVHFTRQSAFVVVDGERIVQNLFVFENMAPLASTLRKTYGIGLNLSEQLNKSLVPDRAPLQLMRRTVGPGYRRVIPQSIRSRVNRAMAAVRVINTQDALYDELLAKPGIRSFIDDYYARDIALHRSLASPGSVT
jgi:hypothetical protein